MADEDSWLQETVIEFLRGPCYTNPLMGFIDEKCIIFDNDDENKLEYTQVHEEFKEVVDSLITDFLEEIGVTHEQFVDTVAKELNGDNINSFVVSSILTVEDFVQFKAMMVKRNLDLTNQVLGLIEDEHMAKVMEQHQNYMSEVSKLDGMTDEDMLAEAMKLSTMQFGTPGMDDDIAAALKASSQDEDAEFGEEFKQALALSMKEQSALDLEKAELEQALALSMALEQEQRRLAAIEVASAPPAAAPAAVPAAAPAAVPAAKAPPAAAAPPPAAAPVAKASPPVPAPATPAPAAAAPAFKAPAASAAAPPAAAAAAAAAPASKTPAAAPAPVLNPLASKAAPPPFHVSPYMQPPAGAPAPAPAAPAGSSLPDTASLPSVGMAGTKVLRGAAGYSSSAGNSAADFAAIREAAAQAAKAQKGMLMARKQAVSEKADAAASSAGQVSEIERQRREAYLKKQREALLEMQRVKREEEMSSYLKDHQRAPRPAAGQAAPDKSAEMDAKRAELRNNLAQQIKMQMIAKQADMGTGSS